MSYTFLQTEWFYSALGFVLALVTSVVGYHQWRKDSAQKIQEEARQTLTKIVENDLRMKEAYRASWSKIAAVKGDADKLIFTRDISKIKDDQVRMSIFQVIDVLADVFHYYRMFNIPLENTLWLKNFYHTFDETKMKAFTTAFEKYKKDEQFTDEFVKFVHEIINQNRDFESTVQLEKANLLKEAA